MPDITKHSSLTDLAALAAGLGDSALKERADELRALVGSSDLQVAPDGFNWRTLKGATPTPDRSIALALKSAWSELYGAEVSLWPQNLQDALATIEAGVGFGNFSQNLASAFQNLRLYEEAVPALEVGMAVTRGLSPSPLPSPFMGEGEGGGADFIPDSAARAGLSFISSPFSLVVPIWVGGAFGRVATAGIARAGGLLGLAEGAASALGTSVGVTVESAGFVATSDALQYVAEGFSPPQEPWNAKAFRYEGYFLQETLSATFIFGGLRVFGWMGGLAQTLLPATETGVAVAKLVGHATSVTGLATMEEVGEGLSPLPAWAAAPARQRVSGGEGRPYEDSRAFSEKLWRALFLHTTINAVNGFMNFNGAGNEYGRIRTRANDIKRLIEAGLLPQELAAAFAGSQAKAGEQIGRLPVRAEFSASNGRQISKEGQEAIYLKDGLTANSVNALIDEIAKQPPDPGFGYPVFGYEKAFYLRASDDLVAINSVAVRGERVATVSGNGEFALIFIKNGAAHVTVYDISVPAILYGELKLAAAIHLTRAEYIKFIDAWKPKDENSQPTSLFDVDIYKKIREHLTPQARAYFAKLITEQGLFRRVHKGKDGYAGFSRRRINRRDQGSVSFVSDLLDENSYIALQSSVKTADWNIRHKSLEAIINGSDLFDTVYISNIAHSLRGNLELCRGLLSKGHGRVVFSITHGELSRQDEMNIGDDITLHPIKQDVEQSFYVLVEAMFRTPNARPSDAGINTVGLFNLEPLGELFRPLGKWFTRAAAKVFGGRKEKPAKRVAVISTSPLAIRLSDVLGRLKNPSFDRSLISHENISDPALYPRSVAALKEVVNSMIASGKRPNDIVVCVAGAGIVAVETIALLRLGVTVVFRETQTNWDTVIEFFGDLYPEMKEAIANRRLIHSDLESSQHTAKYDAVIWVAPKFESMGEKVHESEKAHAFLTENLKDDGVVMIQTERIQYYNALAFDGDMEILFTDPSISTSNHLFPSTMLTLGGIAAVFRRIPKTVPRSPVTEQNQTEQAKPGPTTIAPSEIAPSSVVSEAYPFASAVISVKRDAKHGNQEEPKGPATANTPVRPNVLQRMLKGIRDFFGMVEETTHFTEAARYVLAPQLLTMNFAVQPGKGEVDGDDHLGFKRPGTGPMRVLTRLEIDAIHNDIAKLRALGGKRALADGLFANGKSLMESSWMKAEGEKYINEAVALFDELGLAESAGDGLLELCKYYGADMRNRSGTLWPALRGAAERYEKAAVEAAIPKDKARAKEKARQAWIRYARFHRVLGDQKEGNKTKRGPASQDDYRMAAEAYGRAGDTEARDHMAMKQGSVSLDQAGKLMAAMDSEDYRDGGVDLSQLLGYCRSARDGFMTASASKDPAVASEARRDLEGTVRLSAAVWTNVLDNNRPHISRGLAAVSNPSADAKVQTIRPDYGALKVYPKAIAGLGADIAEAEGLGMMGLKRQAEKTRSAAIAEYVKLAKAVVARARRGRAHRISARFYKHAARMYRNLGMDAEALAVEAELAGLNGAGRDRGGRQPVVEPQGVVSVAEFLKLAEREKNPPRKFELLKRAAEQSERNGGLAQAIEIYGRLAAITDYRNLSHSTRVEAFENIARLSEKIGDPAGYRDACVKTGDSYERWKDAHRNSNVPEKMEKAAEWYMRGKAYDRAVSALLQKAEALFPDGLAAAYKIAVATEALRSFRRNVTSEEIFQTCMKALDTLRSALDIAENKLRDPQRAGEVGQKLIVRLRELNAMSFDTIAKFKDMAEKIADGRTAHVGPKEGRHVMYLQAVDGVRFVSRLAKALGVEGKLPYDPTEKYKKERPTAKRLKTKLDHGSAGTQ